MKNRYLFALTPLVLIAVLFSILSDASNLGGTGVGGGGGGTISMGTFDSQSAAATGAVISGSSLYMQSATASYPGLINTSAQVFSGAKRFQNNVYVGTAPSDALPFSVDSTMITSSGSYFVGNVIGRRTVSSSDSETTYGHLGQSNVTVSSGQSAHGLVVGLMGESKTPGAGTVDFAGGVRGVVTHTGSGGVTNAAALIAGTMTSTGGGSVTSAHALYLNNQTIGTNNYPIYSLGTTETYFTGGSSLAAGKFFVSNNGDLNKIDNVYYNWPASQGSASTVLTNDGSGNLSWATSSGGVTGSGTNTYLTKWTGSGSIGNTMTTEDSAGLTTKTNGNQGTTGTYYQENITYNDTYRGVRSVTAAMSSSSSDNYFVMNNTAMSLSGTNSVSNLQSNGSYLAMTGGTYSGGAVILRGHQVYMTHANQVTDNIAGYNWVYGSHGFSSTVNAGSSGSGMGGFFSVASTKNAVGVEGYARNGVTGGRNFGGRFIATGDNSAQAVGLYAGINSTESLATENYDPGLSSAFAANNGNTTSNIVTLFDNGSSVFQVQDGGSTVVGAHAGTATHVVNGTVKVVRQGPVSVVGLTDGATVALDASLGNTFRLVAGGDRTLLAPSNPIDGQKITVIHYASGANRTLTLTTGAGGFRFGTDITALSATTSGKSDYLGFIYNGADNRWDIVAAVKGY